jgi:geranylgeranyl diphosphate synthase type II
MKMNEYIDLINKKLDEFIQIETPKNLFESMKYTVMLPGKRLRPIMCLETCKIFGGNPEDAIPTACAIEILHSMTLIHDDLPSMDNDDYRRGKLSNHKVYGEAIATLAGDAMLTYAPELITHNSTTLSSDILLKILNEYFRFAGARGVMAGQAVDIESEKKQIVNEKEVLEYIHTHKTSDLFQLAMRTGAIIAGAEDKQLEAITEFAQNFGIAFQIADDILDEISTFEQMGKTLGKDKNEGKLTYVTLYGLEGAKCKLSCLLQRSRDIIEEQNFKSEIFEEIINNIIERVEL